MSARSHPPRTALEHIEDEWFAHAHDIFHTRAWRLVKQHFQVMNRLQGSSATNGETLANVLLRHRRHTDSMRAAFASLTRELRRDQRAKE